MPDGWDRHGTFTVDGGKGETVIGGGTAVAFPLSPSDHVFTDIRFGRHLDFRMGETREAYDLRGIRNAMRALFKCATDPSLDDWTPRIPPAWSD